LSYDEVKSHSQQFLLPCKIIYELHSEFNCIKELARIEEEKNKFEEQFKRKYNKTNTLNEDKKEEDDEENSKDFVEGIYVKQFMNTCNELKEKHPTISKRILIAMGVPVAAKNARVTWLMFLKIQSMLRYYTAT
jgi:predicted nuclease with TOPRIM domain